MIEATQMAALQEASAIKSLHDVPQLLIHWSSPWEEFLTSIRPALRRSPKPLAGEAPIRIFPFRGMVMAWVLESAMLAAAIVIPAKLASLQPYVPPARPQYDVIYFSGEELPQTEDLGGAEKGKSGRAGGQHAQHPTQSIHVVRANSPMEKVVDAPKINLPKTDFPVANLLAIHRVPGPPPTAGLKPSPLSLPQVDPIAPAPNASRDKLQLPPSLATTIVGPPPEVQRDKVQAAPSMLASVVAPPPDIARDKMRAIQGMSSPVISPPPQVTREKMRDIQTANTSVIAPPPSVQADVAGMRLPATHSTEVVPPPVSAPASPDARTSKLSLPQPSIVAPPPSTVSRELSSYGSAKMNGLRRQQVVPPPVEVAGGATGRSPSKSTALPINVVPPPPAVPSGGANRSGRSVGGAATLAANVVPPPPNLTSSASLTRGHGGSGTGPGGNLEMGSVAAPPKAGGTGASNTAVVVSSQPGSRVGVPGSGGRGAIAVSPAGGSKTGIGGSGNGGSLGRGNGPGSGLSGEGTGAASTGSGRGSDPTSKSGISPYPGAGGAGTTVAGVSGTPGISVSGGNTITLPSFGGGSAPDIADPSRTRLSKRGPGITIVATSRSGGAFNFYGALKGDPVYTIYFETTLGTAVLEYADPTSAHHVYAQELSAPEPLRADLPAGLTRSRMVIACILDQAGVLRNVRVLESGPARMSAKVLASLPGWKFKPAFRGDQPVEVNAILGFNIDTR